MTMNPMKLVKSTTPEEPRAAIFPEESFQNPFAAINPVEMSKNVLLRTSSMVAMLRASAFSEANFDLDQLGYSLDQVAANLNMLEWMLEYWEGLPDSD